ncbi:MAG TPA: (2Fe-2S)-binding protein, partial [Caulobacteraceae bacterium]|nr:(2Fe-2S)-binding protein [Caulobacteraceae bacterium]
TADAAAGALPPRDWLVELFADTTLGPLQRAALLIGRAPGQPLDTSALVCACRGVRRSRIAAAVESGAASVDAIGEATGAGASCGSCHAEIATIVAEALKAAA